MSHPEPTPTYPSIVEQIFTPSLLEYAHGVTFPWDLDRPLKAGAVGHHFHTLATDASKWDVPQIRTALNQLADIGFDNLDLEGFTRFVRDYAVDGDGRLRFPGVIVILIHAARHLCRGVEERYYYHYFEPIALHMLRGVIGLGERLMLSDWEAAGIDANQAVIRILVVVRPLAYSEDRRDHERMLKILERLRGQYGRMTRTHDPHRATLAADLEDAELLGVMKREGPPEAQGTKMPDFVYWIMRFYAVHVAVVRRFGRSPARNVAVGREDGEGEGAWLERCGVMRTEEDEEVRRRVREDVEAGRWTPLEL